MPETQGQNLALTSPYVPYSFDSNNLTSDIDIKMLFPEVDSPEISHFWRVAKPKHAKSGLCSRRINFRNQYFNIDIGVKTWGWVRQGVFDAAGAVSVVH